MVDRALCHALPVIESVALSIAAVMLLNFRVAVSA